MRTRLAIVAAVGLAAACGPNHAKLCNASQQARAAGKYEGISIEAAKEVNARYAYDCSSACYDGHKSGIADPSDAPACVERDLLDADVHHREGMVKLAGVCRDGAGPKLACEWVAKHQAALVAWKATKRSEADARRAPGAVDVATYIVEAKQLIAGAGWTEVSDQTYAFDVGGYIEFDYELQVGMAAFVLLVGRDTTTFTAGNRSLNGVPIGFDPMAMTPPGIFALEMRGKHGTNTDVRQTVTILVAADSDWGDVRALVSTKPVTEP